MIKVNYPRSYFENTGDIKKGDLLIFKKFSEDPMLDDSCCCDEDIEEYGQ